MPDGYGAQIDDLLDQARWMEHGPAQAALVEQAVRLADEHADLEAGFRARLDYISAATFSGWHDQALVAFSWCLAQSDREPEKFSEFQLLWPYKWIIGEALAFPHISLAQIDGLLKDMEARYQKAGSTLRAVHMLRQDVAEHVGDKKAAAQHGKRMDRAPRDWLSNCAACEVDGRVGSLIFQGKYAAAVTAAGPILAGFSRCAEVPQRTYAKLLIPLLRLGRVEEAADLYRQGYRAISRNPKFLYYWGSHLTFLALTGNQAAAVKMLQKHLPDALASVSLSSRFYFYLAGRLLCGQLVRAGTAELKLKLPDGVPVAAEKGRVPLAKLGDWFREAAKEIAAKFDARNGTTAFARQAAAHQRLAKFACDYPL